MELNRQNQIDLLAREKIVHDIKHNFFVEAGAGSGKTTVLVERMVAMVEEGIDISKISAITFTKAAASEFYARFLARLSERANEIVDDNFVYEPNKLNKPTDLTRARCKAALENIDLCFMGTIDAFCNMVMSEHPNEGLIPSNSVIIDEKQAEKIYTDAYTDILNCLYEDQTLLAKTNNFLAYNSYPQDTFVCILKALLNHRDCEVVVPSYDTQNIDVKYADSIKTIRKIVKTICEHPEFINAANQDKIDVLAHNFERYKNTFNQTWNDNIPNILSAYKATLGNSDFRLYDNEKVTGALGEGSSYFIKNSGRGAWLLIDDDKLNIFKEIEANKYAISLDFVNSAKELILTKLRKQGKLTFNDYLIYLRDTLKADAINGGKLIKYIYERHSYFLIDEFQDTDPIQAEIFFYLSAKELNSKWQACVPHAGSLFIVGDPKQSIYRFKNADVASFIKVREMFNGEVGEVLNLFCNFRSTYEIKNYFNNTFVELLKDSDEQAQYPLIPINEDEIKEEFTGVYKYDVPASNKDKDEKLFDPYKVKQIIQKLVDNDSYQIYAKEIVDGKSVKIIRKLKYSDFMLITPSKPALSKYAKEFKESGIPYFVEGNIDFKECQAFETLLYLYGAVTNENDNRYLYAVLKSSLYQLSEKELVEAIDKGFIFDIHFKLDNFDGDNKLKDVVKQLQNYNDLSHKLSPSTLLKLLIETSACFKASGNKNMEYVYYALELIKNKENSKDIITHNDALSFLEDLLYTKNNIERCPGFMLDGNLVHIANLHKVKGLEAPVVILASPKKNSVDVSFRTIRNDEGNKGYLFRVEKRLDNGISYKVIETNKYADTFEQDELASTEAENLRLAYVAATRARNVLIIANSMTKSGPSKTNPWLSLLNEQMLDIEEQLSLVTAKENNIGEIIIEDDKQENILMRNSQYLSNNSFIIKRPSSQTNIVHIENDEDELKTLKNIDEANEDNTSTIIGSMVHRLIELIILSKDQMSLADLSKQIMVEEKQTDERYLNILSNVYDKLHHGGYKQENNCPENILPILLTAQEAYPELPFTYKDNEVIWNGVIDMLYRKDDKLHIIDWKTNKQASGLDEHYKNQLAIYTRVVEDITKEKVEDSLIYHIEIN